PNLLSLVRLKWQDIAGGVEWEAGLWGAPLRPTRLLLHPPCPRLWSVYFLNCHFPCRSHFFLTSWKSSSKLVSNSLETATWSETQSLFPANCATSSLGQKSQ